MIQPGIGYTSSNVGGAVTLNVDPAWQFFPGDPEQFRVNVIRTASGYGVQCRKGFVRSPIYKRYGPWFQTLAQFEVQKFYGFPDGSKTTGPFATPDESPLVDLGGYVQIQPASVEGGSDNWGVYVIGCPGVDTEDFRPYLAIMADDSDADTKSEPFEVGQAITWFILYNSVGRFINTPAGTEYIVFYEVMGQAHRNYNCQKWKVADLVWDGTEFQVTQKHLGPLALNSPVIFAGWSILDPAFPPAWFPVPYYEAEFLAWNGPWSGYTKDPSGATVEV